MDCSLAALIACFSWSGFYIDGGVVIADKGDSYRYMSQDSQRVERDDGLVENISTATAREANLNNNPYGTFAIGYELNLSSRVRASVEALHQSSLSTSQDRGVNSLRLSLRWYPGR